MTNPHRFRHFVPGRCDRCGNEIPRHCLTSYERWNEERDWPHLKPAHMCHLCLWRECMIARGCNYVSIDKQDRLVRYTEFTKRAVA